MGETGVRTGRRDAVREIMTGKGEMHLDDVIHQMICLGIECPGREQVRDTLRRMPGIVRVGRSTWWLP